MVENEIFLADKHTPIQYLLRKQESPMITADLPAGLSRIEVSSLQVSLEVLAYDANNKDFYWNIFQLMNLSVAGPYVNNFSRTKDRNKA